MNVITLKTVDSTNRYLKDLLRTTLSLPNFLTVFTPQQTAGRGQYGAKWDSQPFVNLTFSVLYAPKYLTLEDAFLLNMAVPIAVLRALDSYGVAETFIKWPNDIILQDKKIGGILIENIVSGQLVEKSVIGIGLNVNQMNFEGLPKASSLRKIVGESFEVELLMEEIVLQMETLLPTFLEKGFEGGYRSYQKYLFRKDKVSAFRQKEGINFMGVIKGVAPTGRLLVETEIGIRSFELKEIELLY